jgi:Family of unknown function (DUF6194)
MTGALAPGDILARLQRLDPELRRKRYYGEQALFYNPGESAPLGVIFASIKDHDGPNDRRAELSRPGVFRLAFGLTPDSFAKHFGAIPARPRKGEAVALTSWDLTRLDALMPHPVYAWMSWVQILSPTRASFDSLRPLLAESLEAAKGKWDQRNASPR